MGRYRCVFLAALVVLIAVPFAVAETKTVFINSDDWRDVYSGVLYANINGYDSFFMTSAKHSLYVSQIPKDADLLEMAVTAIELQKRTNIDTSDWINNTEKRLKTQSAKKLLECLKSCNPNEWWKDLKKF